MTSNKTHSKELHASDPQDAEILAKYGISRIPVDYFHYKGFRYTNLQDAIAQAQRDNQDPTSDVS